ncbi:MAG TPA: hypothetical protein VGS19_06790 [Streptosporangiaceae bacterium]|nr:hypothetical protein [Streptosporangiaceae bacterium]
MGTDPAALAHHYHAILLGLVLMRDNGVVSDPAAATQVLRTRYRARLPSSLGELMGPAHGVVELPAHVAWSGLTAYDLDGARSCMTLYRTVLAEGLRDDLSSLLNQDLLLSQWPILRNLISRNIRDVWESAFPELRGTCKTGT